MFKEKEIQLLIEFTKNRKKIDAADLILEESFVTLIKKLDSESNIIDKPFSVDTV